MFTVLSQTSCSQLQRFLHLQWPVSLYLAVFSFELLPTTCLPTRLSWWHRRHLRPSGRLDTTIQKTAVSSALHHDSVANGSNPSHPSNSTTLPALSPASWRGTNQRKRYRFGTTVPTLQYLLVSASLRTRGLFEYTIRYHHSSPEKLPASIYEH